MAIVTPEWVKDAVFYQIFPDRFARSGRVKAPGPFEAWDVAPTVHGFKGGDLYGISDRLDELADLGVTALYLNPIFASASNHRYHTYDYFRVDPLLGGDDGLRALLDAAHARGMRVILDGVFNHASRGFWPFNHVLECGLGSPYIDWFHVDRNALSAGRPLRAYPDESLIQALTSSGLAVPHSGAESLLSLGYRAWWDLPALPKLNTDNQEVREYLFAVAEHWIAFGADGWRLDVAAEIDDDEFWREFRRRVKGANPEAYIVAEIWHEEHRWVRGDQFDAYMNYPFMQATVSFCAGGHLDRRVVGQQGDLARTVRPIDGHTFAGWLGHALSCYDPAVNAVQLNLLGSHDTPRLRTMCGGDLAAVRLATLVQMTVGGAPSIYYGDELGLEGEHDPGCRGAYPTDAGAGDRELRAFVAGATAFRHGHRSARRGTFAVVSAGEASVAYRRDDADEHVLVCLNAGSDAATLAVDLPDLAGATLRPVTWDGWTWPVPASATVTDGRATIVLPGRSAALYVAERGA